MPKETIMSKISDEEFANIVISSSSLKEIAYKCGYLNYSGANSKIIKNRIEEQQLDFQTFYKPGVYRKDEEIFIENSPVDQTTLRRRYLSGNFTEYKCAICGQEPIWNGKELNLTLDHKNGHNHDDRLENLRWVCPNCDRQLSTFAGKNIVKKKEKKGKKYCVDCGIEISQSAIRCHSCAAIKTGQLQRKVERPSREELKSQIRSKPFLEIGRNYNVSDNAVRKWCDTYNLPKTKKEISKYNDIEWENL